MHVCMDSAWMRCLHRIDRRENCDQPDDDKDAHDELDDAGDQEQHTRLW